MRIGEIISDSIKYPISNWKNFLFLGLIVIIGDLYSILAVAGIKSVLISILGIVAFLFMIFRYGYALRVMESSTAGGKIIPELNRWTEMFVDGIKVLVVALVYIFPLIIITIPMIIYIGFTSFSSGTGLNETSFFRSLIIVFLVMGIYMLFVYPILLMSTVNMANNKKDIGAAFKFGAIKNIISNVGLGKFIGWYITTGVIYLLLTIFGYALLAIFNLIHIKIIATVLFSLIIVPFAIIFLYRSSALIYLDGIKNDKTAADEIAGE